MNKPVSQITLFFSDFCVQFEQEKHFKFSEMYSSLSKTDSGELQTHLKLENKIYCYVFKEDVIYLPFQVLFYNF